MELGELLYEGKAKSIYRSESEDELISRFRDDMTAFNGEKKNSFANKGTYNAAVSAFFFDYLEKEDVETHFIRMLDDRTMLVKKLEMIPLEVIARNIATGSIVRKLPFEEGQVLNPPVIVTDYKDDERGDPAVNDDLIVALGLLSPDELSEVRSVTLKINRILFEFFDRLGFVLVDFKIEFGRLGDRIVLGDEISMDSMRLWDKETKKSFDKDVYRFDKGDVMDAYAEVVEKIEEWRKEHLK